MSLRGPVLTLTARREAPSLMGRMGRVGRSRKVSFKFLHTLWVFRTCIYILVYEMKIVTNILMGFKIWCQVGVWGTLFSKLPYSREFSNFWFQKSTVISRKRSLWTIFENFKNLSVFEAPTMFDGTDGHQKCPLNFFKLCGYLELVYIYLYTK